MMPDHEQIMIGAERYALGRRTYIVGDTVKYIANHINGMTNYCRQILIKDIENPICNSYGDDCDKNDWMWLLERLNNVTLLCPTTKQPCFQCTPFCNEQICKTKE